MRQKGYAPLFTIFVLVGIGLLVYLSLFYRKSTPSTPQPMSTEPASTASSNLTSSKLENENDYAESHVTLIKESQWVHLSSNKVGVSFDYLVPSVVGQIQYTFRDYGDNNGDPRGQIYDWEFIVYSPPEEAWTYSIASGVSSDFAIGRSSWFTDFYKLKVSDYKDAIKIYKTKYGTDAVLKYAPNLMSLNNPNDVIILVDLPIKKDARFKGLGIYVKDGLTDEQAIRIINSLTVN